MHVAATPSKIAKHSKGYTLSRVKDNSITLSLGEFDEQKMTKRTHRWVWPGIEPGTG